MHMLPKDKDGSERTPTFLLRHLKIQESWLQGEGSRDRQARGMWSAGDNWEQHRIQGGGQQAGEQQGQGAQLSVLQLSLVLPGQKYCCLPFNQTQMRGANGLPMVTLRDWLSSHQLSASRLHLSLGGRYQGKGKQRSVCMSL